MYIRSGFIVIFFLSLLLVAFSCKKVTDEMDPIIIIENPTENETYNMPDTILIKASVSDDEKIESIHIVVTDEFLNPSFGAYSYPPQGNPTEIYDQMVIDDFQLSSGTYYLKIRAFDGVNGKNEFRKIYINEVPRELMDIIVITDYVGGCKVNGINSDFTISKLFNTDITYVCSEMNSWDQQLYIAGKYYDGVNAFDLKKNEKEWTMDGMNIPPLPYYKNLYYENRLLFISNSEGDIRAYNYNQVNIASVSLTQNLIPGCCCVDDDYIVTEAMEISGTKTYLQSFYISSGSFFYERLINMDVVAIYDRGYNRMFVVANASGDAGIFIYNIRENLLDEIKTISNKEIIAAVNIDANNLLLAFNDGVHLYNYSFNSLTLFAANDNVKQIRFDELANILYIAESNKVLSYSYPQGSFINEVAIQDEILNIHLHYNK